MPTDDRPTRCPNCEATLLQPDAPYCPACGQETRIRPPTLMEFAQQFGGAYLSTEGALWRSLWMLVRRPGELTRLYLAGRRKHYVLPLRLYLTLSLASLLVLRLVTGAAPLEVRFDDTPSGRQAARDIHVDIGPLGAGFRDGVFYCDRLPDWTCRRIRDRIDFAPSSTGQQLTLFRERFVNNLGGAMFVLMPAFALWLKLVYLNRRMRFTEHLVFALHVHAFWFVALLVTLPGWDWLSTIIFVGVPWYTFAAMRRVYLGRRGPRLLRGLVVTMLYGITLGAALLGVAVWSLLA